jgi:hypothetical protein
MTRTFNINAPISARKLRRLRRQCKLANPGLVSALRRMTDAQLRDLEAELLEQELARLRRHPKFRTSPELQQQVARHEYDLRLLRELEHWHNWTPSSTRYCRNVDDGAV